MESIDGSLRRLQTDYVDLYQAHRFDHATPLEETMEAFADIVRAGKALYIGVSEWRAEEIRAGHALARELRIPLISNQPQYSMLWRVIEAEVVPTCDELGMGQIVWSPMAQGVLTGKYLPGQAPPAGSRATDDRAAPKMIAPDAHRRVLTRGAAAAAARRRGRADHGPARGGVGAAEPERLLGDHRRLPARAGGGEREGRPGSPWTRTLLKAIDEVLAPVVSRDPALTQSP